jgi:cystathionine beta-lyase
MFDFDRATERCNTDSLKYDFALRRNMPEDVLPLWVADMDFPAPPCVLNALAEKCSHGIFGYSDTREDYFEVLAHWFTKRFSFHIQPEWLVKTPGVVYAIATAIRAFTKPGDGVLIQPPVYYPFSDVIRRNHRTLVENPLVITDGHYEIDFNGFEQAIMEHNVKLFLLCSPHNPVGRVWTKEELTRLGDICLKHGVIVAADEIHQDFVYPGFTHHVFAGLKPEFQKIAITLTAPTKTFNLAGLQISNILIADKQLRHLFTEELAASGYSQPNVMGITACKAAYGQGEPWLNEFLSYLQGNLRFLDAFIKDKLPGIRLVIPEGTYLCWLDMRGLLLEAEEVNRLIIHKAKLWLDDGRMFGTGGEGFQRINIACPRALLEKALVQLASAFEKYL